MALARKRNGTRAGEHQIGGRALAAPILQFERLLDAVMMPATAWLPVGFGPEQLPVAKVRHDVIDDLRRTLEPNGLTP